jgi:hypothetical protein
VVQHLLHAGAWLAARLGLRFTSTVASLRRFFRQLVSSSPASAAAAFSSEALPVC